MKKTWSKKMILLVTGIVSVVFVIALYGVLSVAYQLPLSLNRNYHFFERSKEFIALQEGTIVEQSFESSADSISNVSVVIQKAQGVDSGEVLLRFQEEGSGKWIAERIVPVAELTQGWAPTEITIPDLTGAQGKRYVLQISARGLKKTSTDTSVEPALRIILPKNHNVPEPVVSVDGTRTTGKTVMVSIIGKSTLADYMDDAGADILERFKNQQLFFAGYTVLMVSLAGLFIWRVLRE